MKKLTILLLFIVASFAYSQEQANTNRNWYDAYTTVEQKNIPPTPGDAKINCIEQKILIYGSGNAYLPPVYPGSFKNVDVDLYFKIDSEKKRRLYGILEMDLEDDGLEIYGTYTINNKQHNRRIIPRCGWFDFDEYVEFNSKDFTTINMNINKVVAKPGAKAGAREFLITVRVSYNEM